MNDLKERLERIAAAPGPVTSVDAAAAVRRGRRIRRGRRAAVGGLAAGLAAAAVAAAVLPGSPDEPRRVRPAEQVRYPDLLVPPASFGWLPPGYAQSKVSRDDQERPSVTVSAGMGKGKDAEGAASAVELTVLGPGKEPPIAHLPGGKKGRWTGTALINGVVGHWTIEPGGPGSGQVPAELRWEYRPHQWALLSVFDRGIAKKETVQRIAKGVRFGGVRPVAFPFRATGVPAGLKPAQVSLGQGPDAELWLTSTGQESGDLLITVTPAGKRAPGRTNTTVDGHPAFDSRLPHTGPKAKTDRNPAEAQRLVVYGVHGLDVTVQATGGPLRLLQPKGGLTGLYHRVTLLGGDPARWTTAPLG
ncbi:hypothetical protein [Actinomadura sp. NTSP31]|uniref:hypothetical protein n=1 Tax=Actinomadura sp. NTSP31 TaxID=1735447 RepID=UPI0035C09F8D